MFRSRVYLLLALTASLGWFVLGATHFSYAQTAASVTMDAAAVRDGKTLELEQGAKLGIFPGGLLNEASVTWQTDSEHVPALPDKKSRLGEAYRLQITGTSFNPDLKRPIAVGIPFGSSHWIRQVWQYDQPSQVWTPLATTLGKGKTLGQAVPTTLDGWIVVLEDRTQQEGIASWYCKRSCSKKYPALHGTSNDFPVGTTVRVRNLQNGKSVDVKIISRWGQPAGRVVDLSGPAFAALGSSNAGLARVNVSIPKPKVLGVSTGAPVTKLEIIPKLNIQSKSQSAFPQITPRPYYVIDQGSGTVLAQNQPDAVVPIASLTKLMTAAVFLDTHTDMKRTFTYTAADQTPYAYLRVKPGETMLIRDLFYSLLVGSANNAAPALARAAGLSQADFIARMNQKAQEWGMTNTKFVDTHGLDPANVSTAHDLAILTMHALHDYEPIRFVSVKREYTFTTINTHVSHTLKSTDKVLGSGMLPQNLIVTGGKTGFINEAKYTYALRTASKDTGAQIVVVLLASNTSTQRFQDAAAITTWAFQNFSWGA